MSVSNRRIFFDKILRVSQLVGIISIIFYLGSWTKDAETKMFDSPAQKEQTISHSRANDTHMPLKAKEEHFVTRREYEAAIVYIKESLERIEKNKK